jgi:hypothetical protein
MGRGRGYGKNLLRDDDLGQEIDRHGIGVPAYAEEADPNFLFRGCMLYHIGGDFRVDVGQPGPPPE